VGIGTLRVTALTIFFFLIVVGHALALDEVFIFNVHSTEYCGDFSHRAVGPRNTHLWIQILSDTEMIVSFTSTFDPGTTFLLNGSTYFTGKTKAVFAGGVSFENNSYFIIQGTLYFDKFKTVTFMKGVFTDNGVLHHGCFSAGNFWTKQKY
jgi:hypothetical protein